MASKTSNNDIKDMSQDWGMDTSVGLPYSGAAVQKFIKDRLNSKAGFFHYDPAGSRYLVFADEQSRDTWLLNPTQEHLVIGSFDAPSNYELTVDLATDAYVPVLLGSTGHTVDFTFSTRTKSGETVTEGVTAVWTFVRGSLKQTLSAAYRAGQKVSMPVDSYLSEGTNTVTVTLKGETTMATAAATVTFQVVDLQLSSTYDISRVYDLLSAPGAVAEVPFSVSGYGTKVVEFYLDGVQLPFDAVLDEVTGISAQRTRIIPLSGLSQGAHSLQMRAYTTVGGERFLSRTLYRDLMVYTGEEGDMVALSLDIPSGEVMQGVPVLKDAVQYIPYSFRMAAYAPGGRPVGTRVSYGGKEIASMELLSGEVEEFSYTFYDYGHRVIRIASATSVRTLYLEVAKSPNSMEEITTELELDLRAGGKTNASSDRDSWSYGKYSSVMSGFKWTARSGWDGGELVMSGGESVVVDLAPLATDATSTGRTIEFEFATEDVTDEDSVICDMMDSSGAGILITASSVVLRSAGGREVSRRFRSGERIRVGFVINRDFGVDDSGMAFLYINGESSGSMGFPETDNFLSSKELSFRSDGGAVIRLRSVMVYNTSLTEDEMLNNFMIYRPTLEEMMAAYRRNDIMEEGTGKFSPDKLADWLPVMIVTGDIPALEATTDKNKSIVVDVEYIDRQNPHLSFLLKNAQMQPQGTSSMGFPKKNFRLYSAKREDTVLYDFEGKVVMNRLYAFRDGAAPVDCWCLKADYAESSSSHNTAIARLWNGVMKNMQVGGEYVGRTRAQQAAIDGGYKYDVRTTVDGFPIVMFYRLTKDSDPVFIGKYNFNNDKSTEQVFGFTGIPGFDNSRMQCWEVLNNGHHLALFQDVENFDSEWKDAFESRYPDTKNPDTSDLKAFAVWLVSTKDFAREKWDHMDVYKMAAYYVYALRFGAVDQLVKNSMFTSEDGRHFYFILYDNDTVLGLRNDGYLLYPPTITRQSLDETYETQVYAYAGHDSRLWNSLEADAEFMQIVREVDAALYNAGLTYAQVVKEFDDRQSSKWCERVYNKDARYKYISPYVESGTDNLYMMQGSRRSHRRWWLSSRFSFVDSLLVSGEYKNNIVEMKLANAPVGLPFSIVAAREGNYGYGVNDVAVSFGIPLEAGQRHDFNTVQVLNIGDPLRIYAAPYLQEVDLSGLMPYMSTLNVGGVASDTLGTSLKVLKLGVRSAEDGRRNSSLKAISGLAAASVLEELDIEGFSGITGLDLSSLSRLRVLRAFASGLTGVTLMDGTPIERLELPSTIQGVILSGAAALSAENLQIEGGWSGVSVISIRRSPMLTADWTFVKQWMQEKVTPDSRCSLTMEGVDWRGVAPEDLIALGGIRTSGGALSIKGVVRLSSVTYAQVQALKSLYGRHVFEHGGDLWITGVEQVFLSGPSEVIEGDSATLSADIVSEYPGEVTWSVVSGEGIRVEDGTVYTDDMSLSRQAVIRVSHANVLGEVRSADHSLSVRRAVRPLSGVIEGLDAVSSESQYVLDLFPEGINREFSVSWSLSGDAYEAGYVGLSSADGLFCSVAVLSSDAAGDMVLTATVRDDRGSVFQVSKQVRVGSLLTVFFRSNQEGDSVVEGLEAEVECSGLSYRASSGESLVLPWGKQVSVRFPLLEGYRRPEDVELVTSDVPLEVEGLYATTLVEVLMDDNQDGMDDVSAATAVLSYEGREISGIMSGQKVKVPFGLKYTVSWDALQGYATPSRQTALAESVSASHLGVYMTTVIAVSVSDNQEGLDDVSGVGVSVAWNGGGAVLEGGGSVNVPTGLSVTVTFPEVEGYLSPKQQVATASGSFMEVAGVYYTELLEVVVTSDIALPEGYLVTVSGVGQQTQPQALYKVPYGMSYTVSASQQQGYKVVADQTFVAGAPSRRVSVVYLEKVIMDLGMETDLSCRYIHGVACARTTANCYVVSSEGEYCFPLVYGCGISEGVDNPASYTNNGGTYSHDFVNHLDNAIVSPWIERNEGCVPLKAEVSVADADGILSGVALAQGPDGLYLRFNAVRVPGDGANAVVSALDKDGEVLWSWHLWLWKDSLQPVDITNRTKVVHSILPVNLASRKSEGGIHNWFYQWGRPVPMICGQSAMSTQKAANFGVREAVELAKAGSIGEGIRNPWVFYCGSTTPYNWFGEKSWYNLWDAGCQNTGNSDNRVIKTVYDPCPAGYRMPGGNAFTGFTKANVIGEFDGGWVFKRDASDSVGVFFPAAGCRYYSDGAVYGSGERGYVWLSSSNSQNNAYYLYFYSSFVSSQYSYYRSYAHSVRPVRDI